MEVEPAGKAEREPDGTFSYFLQNVKDWLS